MKLLHLFSVAGVIALGCSPLMAQAGSTGGVRMSWIARTNGFLRTVIERKEASGTPAGLEDYSHHLMILLTGDTTSGISKASLDKLSQRLANAELATRDGKRNLVSEEAIADTFNHLMREVRGRDGAEIRTSVEDVHRMREWDDRISPALSSVETHTSGCLPGEAVFTLVMLVSSNGVVGPAPARPLSDDPPPRGGKLMAYTTRSNETAEGLLGRYARMHWHWQNARLYALVLRDMGI